MRIAKSIRVIFPIIPAGVISVVLANVFGLSGINVLVITFIGYLAFSIIIGKVDWAIRRASKEPSWLRSTEGAEWLKSEEGMEWAKENAYKR